jgi:hypothetical protein
MLKKEIIPVSRKSNIVVQELGSDILIYDLSENKAFSLNKTSALIWQLCNGSRTVSDIAKNLSEKLDSSINEDFVWLGLEGLKKENLLENPNEISTEFGGLSRRELIYKAGFATSVALPYISSLIAPTAANAQSAVSCTVVPTGTPGRLNPNSQCGAPAQPTLGSANCATCCCRAPALNPSNQTICGAPNINPCI